MHRALNRLKTHIVNRPLGFDPQLSSTRLDRSYNVSSYIFNNELIKEKLKEVPDLRAFMAQGFLTGTHTNNEAPVAEDLLPASVPYVQFENPVGTGRSVYVETYGCQMNVSDSEIVNSIMKNAGFKLADIPDVADVIFLNTCAIRDNAEKKIWARLRELKAEKKRRRKDSQMVVGVLGCMAERLKTKLIEEEGLVDLVAGPDSYRDLPRLLSTVDEGSENAINVLLSQDETYADITPVRHSSNGVTAYVSIMRGCNNMCTYCIVPFTRGRERSRSAKTIVEEVRQLSFEGFKEIILLGQNVNSYNDTSEAESSDQLRQVSYPEGFSTVYKKPQIGVSFADLVDRVSQIDPEMRIRFTSPHPKDFPVELLTLIRDRSNVCKSIHIPVQSGSTTTLDRMRRGYSREAYLQLVDNIRSMIPQITLSSDFISGFCGETEEEHRDTITMLEAVRYDFAFMFHYSMREKTPAHRKFADDVPEDIKKQRLKEVIDTFHRILAEKNRNEIGSRHLVLVEGSSKKSANDWAGRSDSNKKVVFPSDPVLDLVYGEVRTIRPGDYVICEIFDTTGLALLGKPIAITTLANWAANIDRYSSKDFLPNPIDAPAKNFKSSKEVEL